MKTTAFESMALGTIAAIAMCVPAGQAALADPIARNHPNSDSRQYQKPAGPGGKQSGDQVRATSSAQSDPEKPERDSAADDVPTGNAAEDLEKRTADARSAASD